MLVQPKDLLMQGDLTIHIRLFRFEMGKIVKFSSRINTDRLGVFCESFESSSRLNVAGKIRNFFS